MKISNFLKYFNVSYTFIKLYFWEKFKIDQWPHWSSTIWSIFSALSMFEERLPSNEFDIVGILFRTHIQVKNWVILYLIQ